MSLRFLADHCVPNLVIQTLQNAGHEVLRLRDYMSADSPDQLVITRAQHLNAILLSLNGDFTDIVTYPPARYKGILALQVRNHPEIIPQLLRRLTEYLSSHSKMEDYMGKLMLAEAHRIRMR